MFSLHSWQPPRRNDELMDGPQACSASTISRIACIMGPHNSIINDDDIYVLRSMNNTSLVDQMQTQLKLTSYYYVQSTLHVMNSILVQSLEGPSDPLHHGWTFNYHFGSKYIMGMILLCTIHTCTIYTPSDDNCRKSCEMAYNVVAPHPLRSLPMAIPSQMGFNPPRKWRIPTQVPCGIGSYKNTTSCLLPTTHAHGLHLALCWNFTNRSNFTSHTLYTYIHCIPPCGSMVAQLGVFPWSNTLDGGLHSPFQGSHMPMSFALL